MIFKVVGNTAISSARCIRQSTRKIRSFILFNVYSVLHDMYYVPHFHIWRALEIVELEKANKAVHGDIAYKTLRLDDLNTALTDFT